MAFPSFSHAAHPAAMAARCNATFFILSSLAMEDGELNAFGENMISRFELSLDAIVDFSHLADFPTLENDPELALEFRNDQMAYLERLLPNGRAFLPYVAPCISWSISYAEQLSAWAENGVEAVGTKEMTVAPRPTFDTHYAPEVVEDLKHIFLQAYGIYSTVVRPEIEGQQSE